MQAMQWLLHPSISALETADLRSSIWLRWPRVNRPGALAPVYMPAPTGVCAAFAHAVAWADPVIALKVRTRIYAGHYSNSALKTAHYSPDRPLPQLVWMCPLDHERHQQTSYRACCSFDSPPGRARLSFAMMDVMVSSCVRRLSTATSRASKVSDRAAGFGSRFDVGDCTMRVCLSNDIWRVPAASTGNCVRGRRSEVGVFSPRLTNPEDDLARSLQYSCQLSQPRISATKGKWVAFSRKILTALSFSAGRNSRSGRSTSGTRFCSNTSVSRD